MSIDSKPIGDIIEYREAALALAKINLPQLGNGAYMTKEVYLELGGQEEDWEAIRGTDE